MSGPNKLVFLHCSIQGTSRLFGGFPLLSSVIHKAKILHKLHSIRINNRHTKSFVC